MKTYRTHGNGPIKIAVIHGGPGGFGSVVNLAVTLSVRYGVLEPFQTERTLMGQVHELNAIIREQASQALIVIGHSWGAWLAYLFAATYPDMVTKLILVGSGPYEHRYYSLLQERRAQRFTPDDLQRLKDLEALLANSDATRAQEILRQIGAVFSRIDNVDLLDDVTPDVEAIDPEILTIDPAYCRNLLEEAMTMRKSGELLQFARAIFCPVVGIHGSADPHPYQGVQEPLQQCLRRFTFHLIPNCGHKPWLERHGRHEFYRILDREFAMSDTLNS